MPFPYSIRTSVHCTTGVSPAAALIAATARLESAGAATLTRADGSLGFGVGWKTPGRHWLSGATDGRITAHEEVGGVVLTAEVAYPVPLVVGTLLAIPLVFLASPSVALLAWLWIVVGNYLIALFALRTHLAKALANALSPAT